MTRLRKVLLSTTALVAIGAAAGMAAAQDAVPVAADQFGYSHKAVADTSFALGLFGGGDENGAMFGAMPSFTAPLGDQVGIQVDGAAGVVAKNKGFVSAGGQLFFRDPQSYLFGVAVGGYHVDSVSRYSISAVAEAYMDDVTLEGQAGYLFGDGKKSAFGRVGASVYATPNLRFGAGVRYDRLTKLGGDVQVEAMLEDVPGMALFGVGAFDEKGATGIGGVRFYFSDALSGRGKQAGGLTLQQIQRTMVARNYFMLDPVSTLRQISQVAGGNVKGLDVGNGGDDDDDDATAQSCSGSGLGTELCTTVTDTTGTVNDLIDAIGAQDPTGQSAEVTELLQQLVSDLGTLVGTTPSPLLNGVPDLLSSLQATLNDPTNAQNNLSGVVGQVATILNQTIDAVQAGAIDSQNNENIGLLTNAVNGLIGLGSTSPVPLPADQLSVLTAFLDVVGTDGGNPDGTDPQQAQSVVDGIQQSLGVILTGVSGQIANPDPTALVGLTPALQNSLTGTFQPLLNFGTALGVPGGAGLPFDSLDATTLTTLLGGLGSLTPGQAGGLGGALGALDPTQLTGLAGSLSSLTPSQVTDVLGTLGVLGAANPTGVGNLVGGLGALGVSDPTGLTNVLGTLGALGVSDPTGLTSVLGGLGGLSGDPLGSLLGGLGGLDPTQLTTVVGGLSTLDPTNLGSVLGGLGTVGAADPTGLVSVLTGLGGLGGDPLNGLLGGLGGLDPTQLTTLVGGLSSLDPTDLGTVLGSLGGLGVSDPTGLTSLLGGLGGLGGDPLSGLLGGLGGLDPAQVTSILGGLSIQDPTDLTNLLGGLGGLATTDPTGLTTILTGLGGLGGDPLSGLLGGLGGLDPTQVTSILGGLTDQDPTQLVDSLVGLGNLLGG